MPLVSHVPPFDSAVVMKERKRSAKVAKEVGMGDPAEVNDIAELPLVNQILCITSSHFYLYKCTAPLFRALMRISLHP
jgi:hypothetical protein